jgi:hypothetical protein
VEKIFCLISIICISCLSSAQILPGGTQIALSHADIAKSNDVFAIFSNPGGLAQIESMEVGAYYSPAPFGMDELKTAYLGCALPLTFGCAGIGFMRYGYELYNISELHLAFGGRYRKKIDYGLSVNCHQLKIQNYGSDVNLQINAGFVIKLNEDISWGASILNANQSTVGECHEVLPSVYTTGFMWNPINDGFIFLAIQKESGNVPDFNFGYSYAPIKYITVLSGYSTNPAMFSAGLSIIYNSIEFDYALTHHNELGYSHHISVIVNICGLSL